MAYDRDKLLLSEFKKALRKNASAPYSNLDDNYMQKFGYFVNRYENIIKETGTHIPPHKSKKVNKSLATEHGKVVDIICKPVFSIRFQVVLKFFWRDRLLS